jgi:hypothetical protein
MKKLLLVATLAVAGFGGSLNAAQTSGNFLADGTKCYKEAIDDFGNHYYAQVPCPDKIIILN